MELRFVTPASRDFRDLAAKLDAYYFELVGDVQLRYAQYNRPENFDALAVVYEGALPIACGGWKAVDTDTAELKRLYVLPEHRRKGAASMLVAALEQSAASTGRTHIILETATNTPASACLYRALGYQEADYYGSPAGADNCLCFEKNL